MADVNPEDFGAVPVQSGPKPEDFGAVAVSSEPQKQAAEPSSVFERIGTGLADMAWGAGQLASRVVPGVDSSIVDQMVKDREAEYEAKRAAAGSEGFDWARLGGNIANPANYFLAGPAALGKLGAMGKLGQSALAGANASSLAPVTNGDFWEEKRNQSLAGAAGGAAARVAGSAASRVINPQTSEAVKDLLSRGITLTPGQILGGSAKKFEDVVSNVFGLGDVITHARKGAIKDLNQALYDMVLEPIGMKFKGKVGREGLEAIRETLDDSYSSLLSGKRIALDGNFASDLRNIYKDALPLMSDSAKKQFLSIVEDKVINARDKSGFVDGDILKAVDSQLGKFAYKFKKPGGGGMDSVNGEMIGDALYMVKNALRSATARSNPALADGIKNLDDAWTVYMRVNSAAARAGSKQGLVTPETMSAAMRNVQRASESKLGKLKGISNELEDIMGGSLPNQESTKRAMLNAILLGGAMHWNPTSLLFAGAAAVPYMPGVNKLTAAALAKRPQSFETVGNAVNKFGEYAAPGAGIAAGQYESNR